jgi:hypothetical protein
MTTTPPDEADADDAYLVPQPRGEQQRVDHDRAVGAAHGM